MNYMASILMISQPLKTLLFFCHIRGPVTLPDFLRLGISIKSPLFFITRRLLIVAALCLFLTTSVSARELWLTATDNYRINANLSSVQNPKGGIVLLHMYKQSKESWQPIIPYLNKAGFTTLAVDMRGHGKSRIGPDAADHQREVNNRNKTFFNTMYRDALAAILFLQNTHHLPLKKIGILGASVGCSVAIHTVVENRLALAGMVLMTPGKNYLGIDTVSQINRWPGIPLLILSSHEEAHRGASFIADHIADSSLVLYDQSDIHGTYMFGEVNGVEEKISTWFRRQIP